MTVTDAGKHIKNITKKYFSGANVDFANRSSRVKSKAPFVCITLGTPTRDLFPTQRLVGNQMVSYYQTKLPVQIDLFTNGSEGEAEGNGFVPMVDTSVDDLTDFVDYLESGYVIDWCHRIEAAIIVNGGVQPLTGLITDTDYEYRAMVELIFCYVHKAVGYTGIQGEASIKYPGQPGEPVDPDGPETPSQPGETPQPGQTGVTPSQPQGDGSEPGYVVPDDTRDDVAVEPTYQPTPSGGRSEELVNTETGYFTEVDIEYKKEESKQ